MIMCVLLCYPVCYSYVAATINRASYFLLKNQMPIKQFLPNSIVFTHGVRMGGWQEKVCPSCISETVRCRKLILGRDIAWGM